MADWSSLPGGIIDVLSDSLKSMGLWKSVSRSLRSFNKHWRTQISYQVQSIRPHESRKLLEADALSLDQFPNVTSIDITRFVKKFEWDEDRAECSLVLSILSRMSSLRDLIISRDIVAKINLAEVKALTSITSLTILDGLKSEKEMMKFVTWPLKYLKVDCRVDQLLDFLSVETGLERLEAEVGRSDIPLTVLPSLVESKIKLTTPLTSGLVACLSSVVYLDMSSQGLVDPEPLTGLPKLKTLVVMVSVPEVLTDSHFLQVIGKLDDLDLRSKWWTMSMPAAIFKEMSRLSVLKLYQFDLRLGALTECLSHIESLDLKQCVLDDYRGMQNVGQIEELCLGHNVSGDNHCLQMWEYLFFLKKLRSLEVDFTGKCPSTEFFVTVACLGQLERLTLNNVLQRMESCYASIVLKGLSSLTVLPDLTELTVTGMATEDLISKLLDLGILKMMESVNISLLIQSAEHESIKRKAEALRAQVPGLKLSLEL